MTDRSMFLGMPVVVSRHVPKGRAFVISDDGAQVLFLTPDAYAMFKFSMNLRDVVDEAHTRLRRLNNHMNGFGLVAEYRLNAIAERLAAS